jgi:biopolymer transport protein TolR
MTRLWSNSLKNLICRIDVSAFAAVMFALVAMFLAPAAVVDVHTHMPVDFAKVGHPVAMRSADRDDAIDVAITRDGQVWLGRDHVLLESLPQTIRERVSQGAERKVYIRADARARYGTVTRVLEGVRSAGIENIAFLVDERKLPAR